MSVAVNEAPVTSNTDERLERLACVVPLMTSEPSSVSEPVVSVTVDELANAARPVTEIEVLVAESELEV